MRRGANSSVVGHANGRSSSDDVMKVGVTQASDALSSASPRELCKCGLEIDVLVRRNIQRLTAKSPRAWYKRRGIPCGPPGFGSAIGASRSKLRW